MSRKSQWLSRFMVGAMIFALCGGPELIQAQSSTPQASTPQSATPDPSRGPQQPAGNEPAAPLPEAPVPNATSPSGSAHQVPSPRNAQQSTEAPAGAAAAQRAETAGGAASKPAGNAIAPAKQRQTRSLLIKIGAVAAAGAAAGIIYGLSRGTGSLPPGATKTTANATNGH